MALSIEDLLHAAPPDPQRIVCMTEETTETLYRIGAGDRVVGISGYTMRPKEAREKPKISTFLDARFDDILALDPDLVLGFSDLQADPARELIKRGVPVHVFNQRSVSEILQSVRMVGALIGCAVEGETLAGELAENLRRHAEAAGQLPRRPRIFLEEWHEPLISGIRWWSELAEIVGADDICEECRFEQSAHGRIFDPKEIARRNPDVVVASWCGRKVSKEKILSRPGWENTAAVKNDQIYEIKSVYILQPGPAALSDGVDQLARIVTAVAHGETLPPPREADPRRAD